MPRLYKVAATTFLSLDLPSPESGVCNLVHPFREAQELQRHHQVTQPQVWAALMVSMPSKMRKRVPHTFRSGTGMLKSQKRLFGLVSAGLK